jgi:hypothetical protein
MSHATEEWDQRLSFDLTIKKVENTKLDMLVAMPDSANIGAIFGLFLADVGRQFLENIGHYFMFPFAAAAALLRTYFAWKDRQLNEGKNGTTRKLALEVVSALAITTAVVGSFFWSTISTLISPIIFTAVLGAKTLFHGGSAVYYSWKAHKANRVAKALGEDGDQIQVSDALAEANRCRQFAKAHAVGFVAGALATTAVVLVMIIAKPILITAGAVAGVVSGAIGALFAAVTYCTLRKPKRPENMREPLVPSRDLERSAPRSASPSNRMHLTVGAGLSPKKKSEVLPVAVSRSPINAAGHRNSFVGTPPKSDGVVDRVTPTVDHRPVLAVFQV